MISLRRLLLVLFFAGLAALEIGHGLFRLDTLRERRRREAVDAVAAGHGKLAGALHGLLGEGRQHAAWWSRTPEVLGLLREEDADARRRLERQVLAYLVSFRGIDRVRVLDEGGRERFRCERIGGGAGALPVAMLERAPDEASLALAAGRADGEVIVSGLAVDAKRVEVAESARRVFHYVAPVEEGERRAGLVVVTVYAAPLQEAVEAFAPLEGVGTALFGEGGELFAASGPAGAVAAAREAREAREPRLETSEGVRLLAPVTSEPPLWLASAIPESALAAATRTLRGEQLRIVASVVLVTLAIAVASAFFVRSSLRAMRLRETELYLARLRRESARYRALMEGAADSILIVDPGLEVVVEANARARAVLGGGGAPLKPSAFLSGADLEAFRDALRRAAASPGQPVDLGELHLAAAGGRPLEVEARFAAIDLLGAPVVEVSLRDRTRERAMERQVRIAERLSSLGLLTAGVAHEINNPLEGIGNYLALLERERDEGRRERHLERVRFGLERIRAIVGELLNFARPRVEGGSADLAQVVERALAVARCTKDVAGVSVERQGLDRPLWVEGDPGRLEQVVLNLLLNAGRAAGPGGRVEIAAGAEDGEAWLAVRDDGPGIAPGDLERIFDPFFTRSGGTGLGLAVSYGIVRAHGGALVARNRRPRGAEVTMRLRVGAPGTRPCEAAAAEGARAP